MNNIDEYKEKTFEDIKHIDELGNDYWDARELMIVLQYLKWEHFAKVINKAKISCKLSGVNVDDRSSRYRGNDKNAKRCDKGSY